MCAIPCLTQVDTCFFLQAIVAMVWYLGSSVCGPGERVDTRAVYPRAAGQST